MQTSAFDGLPDELVVHIMWSVGPSWRVAARAVCRRWAVVVAQPSRAQAAHLALCRPSLARGPSWNAGRVLCASLLARAIREGAQHTPLTLPAVKGLADWCVEAFDPPVPRHEIACALMASAQPAAICHAQTLIESIDPETCGRVMHVGALAATCVDCPDAVKLLLRWAGFRLARSTTQTDDMGDAGHRGGANTHAARHRPTATCDKDKRRRGCRCQRCRITDKYKHYKGEDADGDPMSWLDQLWTLTARNNAGRVAAFLLQTMHNNNNNDNNDNGNGGNNNRDSLNDQKGNKDGGADGNSDHGNAANDSAVSGRLMAAWSKGAWATAAGRAGADAVLDAHTSSGVRLGRTIGQRLAISAAHAGKGRACAFGLIQVYLVTRHRPTSVVCSVASQPRTGTDGTEIDLGLDEDDDDVDDGDGNTDADGNVQAGGVAGRVTTAAVMGRAPGAALDCLEALGLRPNPIALLEAAITYGHACGRGALALAMRWPREAASREGLAWTACAIGRAVSRGYLAQADEVVIAVQPFVDTRDEAPRRSRVDPWREVALDALVAGFTERAPLDTLALLCALALRVGLGDGDALVRALTVDAPACRGALCEPTWAKLADGLADAWSLWCRPTLLNGAALASLLRRMPPAHFATGSALVAWLDGAGLVLGPSL